MQQDNIPQHKSQDLKHAVHVRKPTNITELKQFCEEEWVKIPPQCVTGETVITVYLQLLLLMGGVNRWKLLVV